MYVQVIADEFRKSAESVTYYNKLYIVVIHNLQNSFLFTELKIQAFVDISLFREIISRE